MKKTLLAIFVGLIIPASTLAYANPGKPTGFVNDFAGVLSAQEKQAIESKLTALKYSTGFEVSVATVPSLKGDDVKHFALKLFEDWGIGDKKENNGLLILVAPTERQAWIETGYGTGAVVTDLQAGNIFRSVMAPSFKEGKYGEGIVGAVDALSLIISKSPEAERYSAPDKNSSGPRFNYEWGLFLIVVLFNVIGRILGATKSWWLGGVIGAAIGTVIGIFAGFFFVGIIWIIVLTLAGLLFDYIVSKRPPGSHGGGFWPMFFSGGSGGMGGGGFGGFGGGRSGGGGGGGSW